MINPANKNKKIATNDKKKKLSYSRNRYEKIIAVAFCAVLILLLGSGVYMQRTAKADKDNVVTMRDSAVELVSRITAVDRRLMWVDHSQCMVSRPSSFGERVTYSCDAHYVHTSPIADQQEVDRIVSAITTTLTDSEDIISKVNDRSTGYVGISDATLENSYYNATSFVFNDVRQDKGVCYVRYVLSDAKNNIEVNIECTVGTKKAYFEPIKQI